MEEFGIVPRDGRDLLGEGLLWSSAENALYWVDILTPALHRLYLDDGRIESWPVPEMIGWVVERREAPGLIAGLRSGFAELSLAPFAIRRIVDPEPRLPDNRMNDAAVDRKGRIWAGTMDVNATRDSGALYRLDADRNLETMDDGYRVTNGPAFSADGRIMYHNDTGRGLIYRFEVTAEGELNNKAVFRSFPRGWGAPDGMAVDSEGGLWVAHWGGGRVSRFTPKGEHDRSIALPTPQITNCTFAGPCMDRMFVTSASVGLSGDPLAGALFVINPGVQGFAPEKFAG